MERAQSYPNAPVRANRRSAAAAAPGRLLLILYMIIAHTRRRPDEVESAPLFLYRQLISEDCHVQP